MTNDPVIRYTTDDEYVLDNELSTMNILFPPLQLSICRHAVHDVGV